MLNKCECWFLDVGQGSSNVILLEDGRSIVIDTGPRGSTQTMQLLNQYDSPIELIVISHNDQDHDYNTPTLLTTFKDKIKKVCFLDDGHPPHKIGVLKALADCPELEYQIPNFVRIEAAGGEQTLFSENGITLKAIYPNVCQNIRAPKYKKRAHNVTSAILLLECGDKKVLYAADSTIEAWDSLAQKHPMPVSCDLATIPHHGGKVSPASKSEIADQNRMYSNYINAKYGIISTGTYNDYDHPCIDVIKILKTAKVRVLCTQVTPKCCLAPEQFRSNRRPIAGISRSSWEITTTGSGKHSKDAACAGSVIALISNNQISIENLDSHFAFLHKMKQDGHAVPCV